MLPKFAALFSPVLVGAIWTAGFLSRIGVGMSGGGGAAAGALELASRLPSRFSGLMNGAAAIGAHGMSLILQSALAPANTTLSLLAASYRVGFVSVVDIAHIAPLFLPHWM